MWDKAVDDYKKGYYFTLAPLIAKGKVMVGTSGGELGIRGYIAALDARTGQEVWRTHTIPGPGEPGHDTWTADTWKTGGVSVWLTGHYDPQLNLTYRGTGNAAPWPGDMHPGDNLYSAAVIALDADTGKIRGHHQYHWNDSWDWDEVSTPLLLDVQRGGRTIKSLVHPGRNGYLWLLSGAPTASASSTPSRSSSRKCSRASIPRRDGPLTTPSRSRRRASRSPSVRASGAARTGRRPPSIRRRASCTSPPTKTCAAPWSG